MPLAADEVLLYPRRRRYIIVICIGFADTKIYSRRGEQCSPFSLWFHRQLPIVLTQKPYRYQRKNATKKVRQKPHTIIIHY